MKILYVLLGMTAVLATFYMASCSSISIRTAIEIDAPKEDVYAVLANLENYQEWNPYHRKIDGEFAEGSDLTIYVTRPDGKQVEVPPHMITIEENREITWGGGIKGVFYGKHSFILEPIGNHKTLLKHNEDFSGLAIGFADLPSDIIAEGYHQMNRALQLKLENTQ